MGTILEQAYECNVISTVSTGRGYDPQDESSDPCGTSSGCYGAPYAVVKQGAAVVLGGGLVGGGSVDPAGGDQANAI